MSKIDPAKQQVTEDEENEDQYTLDDLHNVQLTHCDFDGPELFIMSERAYVIGVGGESLDGTAEPGVEHSMATQTIINVRMCMKAWPGEPLLVHLKTCGGHWDQGMAMYSALRAYPYPVIVLNYAEARSMSSIIFCAGDKRVMMPDSHFMFHTGLVSGEWTGRQFRTEYLQWEKTMDKMKAIYKERMAETGAMLSDAAGYTDRDRDLWLEQKMFEEEDVWLDPATAIGMGFAHCVFEDWDSILQFD